LEHVLQLAVKPKCIVFLDDDNEELRRAENLLPHFERLRITLVIGTAYNRANTNFGSKWSDQARCTEVIERCRTWLADEARELKADEKPGADRDRRYSTITTTTAALTPSTEGASPAVPRTPSAHIQRSLWGAVPQPPSEPATGRTDMMDTDSPRRRPGCT
jgi:hypothetical protein